MEKIFSELDSVLQKSVSNCKADSIALSGGIDSSILAYYRKNEKPQAIAVISEDFIASDLTYCQLAAKTFELPLKIKTTPTDELFEAVEETIKILKNFNDIEIRNSVVMYIVVKEIKKLGHNAIITGDGADELFAGYKFLQHKSEEELGKDLKRIWKIMHFPALKIGQSLGVTMENPFLDENVMELAKKIPVDLKVRNEGETRYGKWILRKMFEKKIPDQIIWRKKAALQDGSGTAGLTNLFESIIQEKIFEEKKKKIQDSDGVIIRTRESMYYYEIFKKYHKIEVSNSPKECPYCKCGLEQDTKFCQMCGSFPI